MSGWRSKPGPSHAYQRLLRGEITSERYVAIVKRSVGIRRADELRNPETKGAAA